MAYNSFAFVDIETTGLSAKNDRIIEIGIIKVKNNRICETYETLVNPKIRIPLFISKLTGISQKSLWSAPSLRDVIGEVSSILDDCVFAAHNVLFDYRFLQTEFERYGYSLNNPYFCTAKLSRNLYPGYRRHNLDSIIERLNINCEKRHRALDDAKVLWEFFKIIQKELGKEKLNKKLASHIKNPRKF